jgi:hypothetical protein
MLLLGGCCGELRRHLDGLHEIKQQEKDDTETTENGLEPHGEES